MSEQVTFRSIDIGQSVEVRLDNIRNRSGSLVDPSTVVGKIEDPSANETTYTYGVDSQLVKESTGAYYFLYTVDEAGTWKARIETTTPDVAMEVTFTVDATSF